jgi:hypothetical protein
MKIRVQVYPFAIADVCDNPIFAQVLLNVNKLWLK